MGEAYKEAHNTCLVLLAFCPHNQVRGSLLVYAIMGQDAGILGSLGTWCLESESFLSGVSPSPLGASREDGSNTQERREKALSEHPASSCSWFRFLQKSGGKNLDCRYQMAEASSSEPGCLPKEEREKVKEDDIAYDWKNVHGEWVLKVRPYRVICFFFLRGTCLASQTSEPSPELDHT